MTKELMELADEYAMLRQLTHEDTSKARAALQSAIESLQAANDVTVLHRDSLNETCRKLTAERDAIAAKLATLEADAERLKNESLCHRIAWERMSDAAKDANAECDTMKARIRQLCDLVRKLHKAKGRHHTQLSVCDLFDAVGLPNKRPDAAKGGQQ